MLRAMPLEVFVEGDALYDAMLGDIGRAERSVRFESYILASDAVGRVFVEALSRGATRGIDVRLRVDHAGSWRELNRGDIVRMRAAGVHFEWSRPWSLRRPLVLNRRNHRKLLVVDGTTAYVGGFNLHAPSSQRSYGPGRWRDTHVRFVGEPAAAAAVIFDCYREVPPDWMPPTTASPWLLPNRDDLREAVEVLAVPWSQRTLARRDAESDWLVGAAPAVELLFPTEAPALFGGGHPSANFRRNSL